MNALVQAMTLAAEDAVPVLHTECTAGEAVMLGDRDVDDLVGFEKRLIDGPILEEIAPEIDFLELFGRGEKDLRDHTNEIGPLKENQTLRVQARRIAERGLLRIHRGL